MAGNNVTTKIILVATPYEQILKRPKTFDVSYQFMLLRTYVPVLAYFW
jgi:hypothetical protein